MKKNLGFVGDPYSNNLWLFLPSFLFLFLPPFSLLLPPLPLFWPPGPFVFKGWRWTERDRPSSLFKFIHPYIHPSIHPTTRSSQQDPLRTILTYAMPLRFCHVAPNPCCLRGTVSTLQSPDEKIQAAHGNPGVLVSEGDPLFLMVVGLPTVINK